MVTGKIYTDCDVMVSIAKLKEHPYFGVTLSIKNCYGMTPLNIYGSEADIGEPSTEVTGTRVNVFHAGIRPPSKRAPPELDPDSPRAGDCRIPRIVSEIASARPIHLATAITLMGFDPMAQRGTPPFDDADVYLDFAEYHGLGSRGLSKIEILGTPIADARFPFRT